jgi:hypothetical protein
VAKGRGKEVRLTKVNFLHKIKKKGFDMRSFIHLLFILFPLTVTGTPPAAADSPATAPLAFPNKLIFSETPDIGDKWHGGIRMNDFLIWDSYLNIAGLGAIEMLIAGLPWITDKNDGTALTDNFLVMSCKSRPLRLRVYNRPYEAGLGLRYYTAYFAMKDKDGNYTAGPENDYAVAVFVTQGYRLNHRNYFNLSASLSLGNEGFSGRPSFVSYFIVPGYRFSLGKSWSFAIEYYMTNTGRLPIKILQFSNDFDKLDFDNRGERALYSYLFWGFALCRRHIRIDLDIACHYTFQGPIVPLVGVGWNF